MKPVLDQLVAGAIKANRPRQLGFLDESTGREIVDHVLNGIERLAREGHIVKTPIGSFRYVSHCARAIRDVKTGERVIVPPQRKLKFTAAKKFRGLK